MSHTPSSDASLLAAVDPEIVQTLVTRREAIVRSGRASGLVAAALASGSVPLALGALAGDAYAQVGTPAVVLQVLRFALLLENLENEFYKAVLTGAAFAGVRQQFSAAETAAFTEIQKHEQAHVTLLRTAIQGAGGTPDNYTAASFDFTAGGGSGTGPLTAALANTAAAKGLLLAATQGFEDTGVRAYKGQAGNLLGTATLTTALQIHSIEARHAAKIRRLRRLGVTGTPEAVRLSGTIRGTGLAAAGAPAGAPQAVADLLALIYGGATPEGNHRASGEPGGGAGGDVRRGDRDGAAGGVRPAGVRRAADRRRGGGDRHAVHHRRHRAPAGPAQPGLTGTAARRRRGDASTAAGDRGGDRRVAAADREWSLGSSTGRRSRPPDSTTAAGAGR
jgi:hypothetical protein